MSKRGMIYALRGISPASAVIVSGNAADAWPVCSLPTGLQERLGAVATRHNFRNAEQLLAEPPKIWQPRVALGETAPASVDKAVKLQKALAPALARMQDMNLTEAEFERLALDDYKRVFGFSISDRHWRRVFKRTLDRDAGAEDFARLEIYLDDNAGAANRGKPEFEAANENGELREVIAAFKNPAQPSDMEVAYLWTRSFEQLEEQGKTGKSSKKAKRLLLQFLFSAAPFLASTAAGLRKQFERKYAAWIAGDRRPAAVADHRAESSGRFRGPNLSEADTDTIIGQAVLFHGGRVAEAWRDVMESGELSPEVRAYYLANPASKSYVPRKVRDAVKHDIAMLEDIHHGSRQAQLNGAHISRDWSAVHAGSWYQADDCTLPVYYYEPDEKGWFTLWRGQCLLMIDWRSTCILGYALLSSRNYNAFAIRTLITKVSTDYGLPRKGFYFERGIWKSSKILTGGNSDPFLSDAEVEGGLRDLGLKFIHAKLPRAKPVERVLGLVQNRMEGEAGYCGRNEQTEVFEALKRDKQLVESRKMHPRDRFHSREEWLSRLDKIFSEYNAERQDGKMTGGLSPEDAFAKFQNVADPQIKFGPECRFLLSHHRRPIKVTEDGILLKFGKHRFKYRNEATGHFTGQTVFAWFNPDLPDIITVTDTQRRNPFTVERALDVPGEPTPEPSELMKQELTRAAAHNSHAKCYYRTLKAKFAPQFRRNLIDPETAALGTEIERQGEAFQARQREETTRVGRAQRKAREIGMTISTPAQRRPESTAAAERLSELLSDEKET